MADVIDHAERMTRSGAAGPARRPVELRGLDRRRRRRRRQADPPVRHHDQAGRPHAGRLDRHRSRRSRARSTTRSPSPRPRATPRSARCCRPNIPNNEGVFRAIEVIAPPGTIANGVLPAACAARGLTGFRMVDCAFGCLAMMLPDKVFAASDGGNTGISHRRLPCRPHALHLRRLHLRRLGRPALGRRAGRQLQHVRQHGLALGRGHRGRAADPDRGLRVRARQGRARASSAAACRSGATTASSRRRGSCRSAPTATRIPPYGLYGGEPGRPSQNLLNPDDREPGPAVQAHHDDPPGPGVPPRGRGRRRLRRSAGARPGGGGTRRAQRAGQPGRGRAPTTAWCSTTTARSMRRRRARLRAEHAPRSRVDGDRRP